MAVKLFDVNRDADYSDLDVAPTLLTIQGLVRKAFGEADPYHGLGHALDVERNVFLVCSQPDVQVTNQERLVLRAAALMHDIGYAAYEPSWSRDRREHVAVGLDFVISQLAFAPIFKDNPLYVDVVMTLIAHHDDTNYKYPSVVLDGEVRAVDLSYHGSRIKAFENGLDEEQRVRLAWMTRILREADAMTSTDTDGAQRTFNYSVTRGLPVFAHGNPLNAWCWEESAVGNVRVAAKRSLIDLVSERGKTAAEQNQKAVEAYIAQVCAERGQPYEPPLEPGGPVSGEAIDGFDLRHYQGWNALERTLRDVTLLGDDSLFPYAKATIRPRKVKINDLRPTAYYALNGQLTGHVTLYEALLTCYALSLFELTGMIEYTHKGQTFRMSPPIIETYHEPTENQPVSAIVDGLHRILLASQLGLDSLWVVEVSDVSPQFPLVPLPLTWADVTLCDDVPPTSAKRKFRFDKLSDFPRVATRTTAEITEANFRYFFYRDLSVLGSAGIR